MRWGKGIKAGRVVEDFINVRDFAPTFLELAGLGPHEQMTGRSFASILRSDKSGFLEDRDVMLVGKERHDIGRPNDLGYPVRAIRTKEFLYVHNFHPERWPACDPETDFGNCDPGPTKEVIKSLGGYFYELSFGKRLPDELYDIQRDPECVNNLANDLAYTQTMEGLRYRMMGMLKDEKDPRALGQGAIFDTYKYTGGRAKGYETWLKAQETRVAEELKTKAEEQAKMPRKKKKGAEAE
jgi:arylsulfatase A-like enzyme